MPGRYEFLALVHQQLQPRGYLEVGVQLGGSLSLAQCPAIGIDPNPLIQASGKQQIFTMTSDEFFQRAHRFDGSPGPLDQFNLDLVYLDGSHLFEDTLRDFMNVESFAHRRTVVIFDDVLPYNASIGRRAQPPGDWCGDVWKIPSILADYRPDLSTLLVDAWPVGAFVVWNLEPGNTYLSERYGEILEEYIDDFPPYDDVITRDYAVSVGDALARLENR